MVEKLPKKILSTPVGQKPNRKKWFEVPKTSGATDGFFVFFGTDFFPIFIKEISFSLLCFTLRLLKSKDVGFLPEKKRRVLEIVDETLFYGDFQFSGGLAV